MKRLPQPGNDKEFELIVRDICRKIYNEDNFELYGRRGQGQHGIDGYHLIGEGIIAFQCKEKDTINNSDEKLLKTLKEEMEEEAEKARIFFESNHQITLYVFATTFKNDTKLQDHAALLSENLDFSIVYWGWNTIEEHIQNNFEILKCYYPLFIQEHLPFAEKYVTYISKEKINENVIKEEEKLLELALDYYTINDNENVVLPVVINNIDIPNRLLIDKIKSEVECLQNEALWLVGEGGTGKTSLLFRLAVEYAQSGKKVFLINFENLYFDIGKLHDVLSYIGNKTGDNKAYIFIDNPDYSRDALEFILKNITNYDFDFVIVFSERDLRLKLIKQDHIRYSINCEVGQDEIKPIKIPPSSEQRKAVYKKFYELIDQKDEVVWNVIEEIGLRTNIGFVNATYRILYELKKNRKIHYDFDWIEFEKIAKERFPSLKGSYKYIAVLYLFGIHTPLSILEKIFEPSQGEIDAFLESFNKDSGEPINLFVKEQGDYKYTYFLRTKHEVISELFFKEKHTSKDKLVADIIKVFDPDNFDETKLLIQLFGNKRNIKNNNELDYKKILDFLFLENIIEKVKLNHTLFETIHLAKFWLHLNHGNYKSSVIYLEGVLKGFPHSLLCRKELSKIYQHQEKYDDAEKILLEGLTIKPDDLNSRTELAKLYQHQGKYDDAEKTLLEYLNIKPDDLNSRTELAKIYQHQDSYDDAEKVLLECLKINPSDLNSRSELAKIYQHQNRYGDAEEVLLECLKINPSDLNSRSELAKIYQHQRKNNEAEKRLLELLNLDKNNLQARTELAKAYQHQGKYNEAEKVLLESLRIDNGQLHPRTELAKIYQHQGKYNEAEKILLENLMIDNRQLHHRTELSKVYQHQGKYAEAEKILLELLSLDKKNLQARTELAKIYQHQDKYDEAEEILLESLKIDSKQLHPRTELAKIYQHQDEYAEAERILLELLNLDKKNLQARTELAKIYQHQDKYPEAEKILLESLDIDEKQLHPRTELAKIYLRKGDFVAAERVLLEILKIDSRNCHAMAGLIEVYSKAGDPNRCFKAFDGFLMRIPVTMDSDSGF